MSISFSSADGGLFAANPLRTDRISIKGVNWFGAEGQNAAPDGLWERSAAEYLDFAVEHVVRRGGAGRPRVSNVGRHRDPRLTGGEVA